MRSRARVALADLARSNKRGPVLAEKRSGYPANDDGDYGRLWFRPRAAAGQRRHGRLLCRPDVTELTIELATRASRAPATLDDPFATNTIAGSPAKRATASSPKRWRALGRPRGRKRSLDSCGVSAQTAEDAAASRKIVGRRRQVRRAWLMTAQSATRRMSRTVSAPRTPCNGALGGPLRCAARQAIGRSAPRSSSRFLAR